MTTPDHVEMHTTAGAALVTAHSLSGARVYILIFFFFISRAKHVVRGLPRLYARIINRRIRMYKGVCNITSANKTQSVSFSPWPLRIEKR